MDLIRPAVVAVVTWFVAGFLAGMLYGFATISSPTMSTPARFIWAIALQLAVGLITAGAAALAHGRPRRADIRRHAMASAGFVAVLAVVSAIGNLVSATSVLTTVVALVPQLVGGVLGWLLVSRVVRRSEWRETAAHGAYY
ncbi:MAG TPA: hypothetical protein VGL93_00810 [Streptosporangiaceae bacterium]